MDGVGSILRLDTYVAYRYIEISIFDLIFWTAVLTSIDAFALSLYYQSLWPCVPPVYLDVLTMAASFSFGLPASDMPLNFITFKIRL